MGFVTPYRKLQRYRKLFRSKIVSGNAEIEELHAKVRRLAFKEFSEGLPSANSNRAKSESAKSFRERLQANKAPNYSLPYQSVKRLLEGELVEELPLIFGNDARSIKSQKAIEIEMINSSTLCLFFRDEDDKTKKLFEVKLRDELDTEEWFIQQAIFIGDDTVDLVVTRTSTGAEKAKRTPKRRKPKEDEVCLAVRESAGVSVYSLPEKDGKRIVDKIRGSSVKPKILEGIRRYVKKTGRLVVRAEEVV